MTSCYTNVHVVCYSDEPQNKYLSILKRSLDKFGYNHSVVSKGKPFSFLKYCQELGEFSESFSKENPNTLLCVVDAHDTIFTAPPSEIIRKYHHQSYDGKIIIGTEEELPDWYKLIIAPFNAKLELHQFPLSNSWYLRKGMFKFPKYCNINTGMVLGPPSLISRFFHWCVQNPSEITKKRGGWDDQIQAILYTTHSPEHSASVWLDYEQEFISIGAFHKYSFFCPDHHYDKKNERYVCSHTGKFPIILHANMTQRDNGWRMRLWASKILGDPAPFPISPLFLKVVVVGLLITVVVVVVLVSLLILKKNKSSL